MCLFKLVVVGCKLSRSQAYRRGVLSLGCDSIGVSAWRPVVLV
jgi:hypothetical protein